jgi:hypothetical protein
MLAAIPEEISANVLNELPLSHLWKNRYERHRNTRVSAKNNMV